MSDKKPHHLAEITSRVIECYYSGNSIEYIRKKLNISFLRIKQILADNGVELRPRSSSNYELEQVKQLAKQGYTKKSIIKELKGSVTALDTFLKHNGLKWSDIEAIPRHVQLKKEIIKLRTVDKLSVVEIVEQLNLDLKQQGAVRLLLKENNVPPLTINEEYEARKRRNLSRYGVESTSCVQEVKDKIKKSRQDTKKEKIQIELQFPKIDVKYFVYVFKRPDPSEDNYLQPFYVGKGKDRRPQCHITAARRGWKDNNRYKINTIRKYLKKGLLPVIEIIECQTEQEAYKLEIDLIAKWGRYGVDERGVLTNITPGGEGNTGGQKPVKQYNLFGEYIQKFPSCIGAANFMGTDNGSLIVECCKKKSRAAYGYFWTYAEDKLDLEWCFGGKKKPIYQWDLEGNFVNRFVNAYQAGYQFQQKNNPGAAIRKFAEKSSKYKEFYWTLTSTPPKIF